MLARDRQIPALRGEISAENGDLSIPFEQTGYPLNAYLFRRGGAPCPPDVICTGDHRGIAPTDFKENRRNDRQTTTIVGEGVW
jgi:hypothetical protein